MATTDFATLRARVQALGCELFKYEDDTEGLRELYVVDPKTHELVFVHKSDDSGFDDWLAEREGKPQTTVKRESVRELANASASLRRAAEQVVKALRQAGADGYTGVTLENEGGYADPERGAAKALCVALDELKAVIDVGTAAAEVRAPKTDRAHDDTAQSFSEYVEREISDVKKIVVEISHLAHDGQGSDDMELTLRAIERIAEGASEVLHGEFWDKLTYGLKRIEGGAE
jgi:hypothetical protein